MLALSALALPLLGVLQYRWLGQLSAAQEEQMRRSLIVSGQRLAEHFNAEIMQAHTQLQFGRPLYEADPLAEYAERFAAWSAEARYPKLVRGFYLVTFGDQEETWMLDRAMGQFVAARWPEHLQGLKRELAGRRRAGVAAGPPWSMNPLTGCPSLAAPEVRAQAVPGVGDRRIRLEAPTLESWSVVDLDCAHIAGSLLPALVMEHLSHDGELEYRVQVAARVPVRRVIYDSAETAGGDVFERPDASLNLFTMRAEGRVRRPRGAAAPHMVFMEFVPGVAEGPWTLQMKHRAGSLEQAAAKARHLNMGIGFAALLLLGGGIAAMAVAARRAQALAEAQLEFVAGVSHELRTPLAVIRSAGENLADGITLSEEKAKQYGRLIRDEGRRLSDMVEQILAFAKTEFGQMRLQRTPVDVREILSKAEEACRAEWGRGELEIRREIEAGIPEVKGDATALVHLVRNLLSNAIRHGGDGSPVELRARQAGSQVEIEIRDHGPGIDPEEGKHVFEPFFRGSRARLEQVRGLGLGLTLARRIVEWHGGTIGLAQCEESGARFVVRLPAAGGD